MDRRDRVQVRRVATGPSALEATDPFAREADAPARSKDEDAAAAARARYRVEPMTLLEPDAAIAPRLTCGESLLAIRRRALLERRHDPSGAVGPGLEGDLYLTSRRLIHVGRPTLVFELDDIEEVITSGDRLLLVLRDGAGISIEVDQPRLLRVEISMARATARG
jgi:hypothetical protein